MLLEDLPTPCLLVENSRLDANLSRIQARADAAGVRLRPHTKTHKSVALARRQLSRGAAGITVAKVGEAEVFAAAGIDDIRIAYPVVGRYKLERLAALMNRAAVSFCVDTAEGARAASAFFSDAALRADVLIEVDTGHHRTGVPWDLTASVEFARQVSALPGLRLAGLLTHAGHAYFGPAEDETPDEALHRVALEERDRMLEFASRLAAARIEGIDPEHFEISIGSTPSLTYFQNADLNGFSISEIRPGNYIFCDAMQVALGSARLEQCALTVLATVVSRRRTPDGSDRLFLDCGSKVLTSDVGFNTHGFGILLYDPTTMTPLPHAFITYLSEEHAWVEVPGGATLRVGDRVRLVPNHACVAVNLQKELYLVDGEQVIATLAVDAQGMVR